MNTPAPYSSAELAMRALFKRQPSRSPIDSLRESRVFTTPQRYEWLALLQRVGRQLRMERGPTIGRKRRRRRARGRARHP